MIWEWKLLVLPWQIFWGMNKEIDHPGSTHYIPLIHSICNATRRPYPWHLPIQYFPPLSQHLHHRFGTIAMLQSYKGIQNNELGVLPRPLFLLCFLGILLLDNVNRKHPYTTRTLTNGQSVRVDYGRFGECKGDVWEILYIF